MIDSTLPEGFRRMPGHLPEGVIPTNAEAIRIAVEVLNWSGMRPVLDRLQHARPGLTATVPMATVLQLGIAFKVQDPKRDFLLSDLTRWAATLNRAQRRRIGLSSRFTYNRLQVPWRQLCAALDPEESIFRLDDSGALLTPRLGWLPSLDVFANALVGASCRLPGWRTILPPTPVQAMDSTDVETSAKSRAWTATPDGPDPVAPNDAAPSSEWTHDAAVWPKTGADGRAVVSADLEARIGWRTKTMERGANAFNGRDGHLLVDAGEAGSRFWVPLIRGVLLRAAGSYKATAGIALLDSLLGGISFNTLVVDRGYSYAVPEAWAQQIRSRGLRIVHDLHTAQRRPHPADTLLGAFWLDGSLFPASLPQRMRKLPGFKARTSAEKRDKLHAAYDERAAWAFVPNRRYPDGSVQLKGPARALHVRCVNYPPSTRLGSNIPRTACEPGAPCVCAKTVVIPPTEAEWERQTFVYGTTKWAAHYGLRNLVESQNAQLKYWRGSMRRNSTAMFGTTANTLVFALNSIAVNISMLRDAYGDIDPTSTTSTSHTAPRRRRAPAVVARHLRSKPRRQRSTTRTDTPA
ncbi:hypothetical protein [Curtobacterium oceanosedimentum]|uniref:Transposase DDE domain-containing protein n=1 Tax=Curtobacterium oceanosedimentum TaxID=465820 RepID=A0A147DQZ8_9MICO|nr:hypothetical protein [Curtobacterium oceanosedimentum]KTR52018.1 hypothetical protein NS359_07970 [Curtobacterium oceanosedimentum]